MDKKPRTPPPPRKVQAPKQRQAPRASGERQKTLLYAFAGAGLVGLAIALILVFATGKKGSDVAEGSDGPVKAAMTAAGCTFTSKAVLKPRGKDFHADAPTETTKVKYSTFPPSGGGHYGAWAVWGFYTEPVTSTRVVHNLEHGGVIVWWGPKTSADTVAKLRAFYDDSPNGMFGTPIEGLGSKVALTAWTGDVSRYYKDGYYGIGKVAVCPTFDQKAFTAFRDAYRGHGPEGTPTDANGPGMGP